MDRVVIPEQLPLSPGRHDTLDPTLISKLGTIPSQPMASEAEANQAIGAGIEAAPTVTQSRPVTMPPITPIESLPADQQAELKKFVEQAGGAWVEPVAPSMPTPPPAPVIKTCPNCGWDLAKADTLDVTDDDKQMWLRHLLSGDRFIKQYSLYGGALVVTLRNARVAEQDLIMNQLSADKVSGQITNETIPYWINRYKLAACLHEIRYRDGKVLICPELINETGGCGYSPPDGMSPVKFAATTRFAQWPDSIASSLIYCQTHFDILCARMQMMARDEDFFAEPRGAI